MDNKTKVDRIHDQMPRTFRTRTNPNWNALIGALGESDQRITTLLEEVRKQFFVKTASRPYIDRLGANSNISRPKFIGMDDPTLRNYIPVLAYQPKQVKLVIDLLLDLFFFKETTTSFTQTGAYEPFRLLDGWELEYKIDQINTESIKFTANDFSDISVATAEEIASAINRQARYSFAIVYDDRITKKRYIRLFTTTIGSKGSIQLVGGRADIAMQFRGFNTAAGSGSTTQWDVTAIGDTTTFQCTGGTSPNLDKVQIGDTVISSIEGNAGSFVIQDINVSDVSFSFSNLFSTQGTYDHALLSPDEKVCFMTAEKIVVYTNSSRSLVWEVTPGELIVEMPASPPVVKRSLMGSGHFNGLVGQMIDYAGNTSLEIVDASEWPSSGQFVLQSLDEIQMHILTPSEDTVVTNQYNTRFDIAEHYSYTSKNGNILQGISPALPVQSAILETVIDTAVRVGDTVTVTTATPHGFIENNWICVQGVSPDIDNSLNGSFTVVSVSTLNSFTYRVLGIDVSATGGVCRIERSGISNSGSLVFLTSAQVDTGTRGPYMWSPTANYVLSSLTTTLQSEIFTGNTARTITIATGNNIPDVESLLVFDFGTEREEGPVRCLYKPNPTTLQLDPAYVFQKHHEIGSSITVIRRRGAHVMSGLGSEYPLYVTDAGVAREVLKQLVLRVKSVGIFVDFLIRFPQQLYSTLDVYKSENTNLWPVDDVEKAKIGL